MTSNRLYPPFHKRLGAVWYRHYRVYTRHLISNGLPPFLEPIIFLAGIALGLGRYIDTMEGVPYLLFLATGLPLTASMYTAAFETTFGTFIRLEYEKVYDGMLGAPVNSRDVILGEILWCGTKGLFFSLAVLVVLSLFRALPGPGSFLISVVGFVTGIMFAAFGLVITSFVKTLNHFNFFMTGVLSPMFFFSGVIFPVGNLPSFLRPVAEVSPLTHTVRLGRALAFSRLEPAHLISVAYCVLFVVFCSYLAVTRLKKRLVL